MDIKDKYLLSIKEAVAYFGIGEKRLRRLVHEQGEAVALWDGNKILIRRIAMEKFLDASSVI